MKISKIKQNLTLCLAMIVSLVAAVEAGNLVNSRRTSAHTYIYKLTDKEASTINRKGLDQLDSTYFHTLVDEYPTDSVYRKKLATGHYLRSYSKGNKQQISYEFVPDFDVKILNNTSDLCVRVYSLKGDIIHHAKVKIGSKSLRYDSKTQSYLDKKSNRQGKLVVQVGDVKSFYELKRNQNNPYLKRVYAKTMWTRPMRYVWQPVSYIVSLPFDGVKSLIKGRAYGSIRRTGWYFQRMSSKINDWYYREYQNDLHYKGYLVLNKPKYQPGDTVKLKAYLVSKKGSPLKKEVQVSLFNGKKKVKLTTLKPYYAGAYEYSFYLHDSLELKLDQHCYVSIEELDGDEYIDSQFKYEAYELNNVRLEFRTDGDKQYSGKPYKVYAKAVDDNNLNVQDGRLELTLTTQQVHKLYNPYRFVPDTLWRYNTKLKPSGETEVEIPDSILGAIDLSYNIHARLLSSDNKSADQKRTINYFHQSSEFEFHVVGDSVSVKFIENGIQKSKQGNLVACDFFGNETNLGSITAPYKFPLNAFYNNYKVRYQDTFNQFQVRSASTGVQCNTSRTADSVFVSISNPRKLNLVYNIYRYNTEVYRGTGTELDYKRATKAKQNYYVSVRYLWGGQIKEETYSIPYVEKALNLSVNQPGLVYPGQKTAMEVTVTDQAGKPVKNVDLTAYALTSKFKYSPPRIPSFDKAKPVKALINNFRLHFPKINDTSRPLNYNAWKTLAEIDSIEYYRFLYPGDSIYRSKHKTSDRITQFAPFVVSNKGEVLPIHVIYVDNRPVYFSWATNQPPYSFAISPGTHQIQLRLYNKTMVLNNVVFEKGIKTILSIPENIRIKGVWIEKAPTILSPFEQENLNKYTFPYRSNYKKSYPYIKDNNSFQPLSSVPEQREFFAGPVSGSIKSGVVDGFSINFEHEPNFEYEIAPALVKMRDVKDENMPSRHQLFSGNHLQNLHDSVLTEKAYTQMKRRSDTISYENDMRNRRYYNTGAIGSCKLQFTLNQNKNLKTNPPLNIVLMRYDTPYFSQVFGGFTRVIHDLKPGFYKLIFMYPGTAHFVTEYIDVKANGKTYLTINEPDKLIKDEFSLTIKELIAKYVYEGQQPHVNKTQQQTAIHGNYLKEYPYTGEGSIVTGHVYDEKTKESLIGAAILVEGTNLSTVSDFNGQFKLKIPKDKHLLKVMYVGYELKIIDLRKAKTINIGLNYNQTALEELVVVAYGSQKKSTVTASISTVSNSFQGRLAGVSSSKSNSLTIRGISAMNGGANTPVIVIDGSIYSGDLSLLDPALIESMEILKDENATALYGSQAANGVVLITSKGNALRTKLAKNNKGASFDEAFVEAASKANTLRSHFSDYAYWQPRLRTDAQGKARFEVTFPDDVTNWQTMVLAMNGKKQSGHSSSNIKAYKPLMAQLAVPTFLSVGDSCRVIGKTLNYLPDSAKVSRDYAINGRTTSLAANYCSDALIDTIALRVPADSLVMQYTLRKSDGYFDGEKRTVPVYPVGLEETKGSFYLLDKEQTINPQFDPSKGKVTLYADADYLELLDKEAAHLLRYQYNCNEQMASKLIAMLSERIILKYKNEKPKHESEINRLITLLLKNRNKQGLWGWWPTGDTHFVFSLHVLKALKQAKQEGFEVAIDNTTLAMNCVSELQSDTLIVLDKHLALLRILKTFDCKIDYQAYIMGIDTLKNLSINEQLQLIELKQQCALPYNSTLLAKLRQTTLFGNVYYADNDDHNALMSNHIRNTLIAYRILRAENKPDSVLAPIRRYFLETKKDCACWNTYETAQILQTILPDVLKNKTKWEKSELVIRGDINQTVSEFPFQLSLAPNSKISISKKGFDAVYLTTHQHEWNKNPQPKADHFVISTQFEHKSNTLQAGKPVKLKVTVQVKKDADYCMIKIPIPGGCSYASKSEGYRWNEYREYFKNETIIYSQKLTKGVYHYEIDLLPRFSGTFTLNPAKVELMYFPVFNGNNELKTIEVR